MKKMDKREEIMRVAMELIAEKGFHGSPMSEIAEKAGVAAGTIYRYFQSKEELIDVLSRELQSHLLVHILKGYPVGSPIRKRYVYIMKSLLKHFIAHPLHFRFLEQHQNSPYGVSLRRDRILGKSTDQDIFKELIEEGIGHKELKNLPLPIMFGLAFGPLIVIMQDYILGFVSLEDALIQKIVEAGWDAIKNESFSGPQSGRQI